MIMANEFRLGLLKDRADNIRPDLTKARRMLEKAEAEHRELTAEAKAFVDPILKESRDIADSRERTREEDATKEMLRREFDGITGPMFHCWSTMSVISPCHLRHQHLGHGGRHKQQPGHVRLSRRASPLLALPRQQNARDRFFSANGTVSGRICAPSR